MGPTVASAGHTSKGQGQGRQTAAKTTVVPSKEVPPGWLDKKQLPSSWLPPLETQEGWPKGATAISCEYRARGAVWAGSPRADQWPAALRMQSKVPGVEVNSQ